MDKVNTWLIRWSPALRIYPLCLMLLGASIDIIVHTLPHVHIYAYIWAYKYRYEDIKWE